MVEEILKAAKNCVRLLLFILDKRLYDKELSTSMRKLLKMDNRIRNELAHCPRTIPKRPQPAGSYTIIYVHT